jgi:hypothetical protein
VRKVSIEYALRRNLEYYAFLLVFLFGSALRLGSIHLAYLALCPLAIVSTMWACFVVYRTEFEGEFETFQSYGVSMWDIVLPVIAVTFIVQLLVTAVAIPEAKNVPFALLCAVVSIAGLCLTFAVVLQSDKSPEVNVLWRCIVAFAAPAATMIAALSLCAAFGIRFA